MMKHNNLTVLAAILAVVLSSASLCAQDAGKYAERYNLLASRLGAAGVGIETLINEWEQVSPDDQDLLVAKYNYYFAKSRTTAVVQKYKTKYLGNKPLFSLKDSTGVQVHYFEETAYDDSLFSIALKTVERAMEQYPDNLAHRFVKASYLIDYEKESPDMAIVSLTGLADEYFADAGRQWTYPEAVADRAFFNSAMQEYCYTFFNIGSVTSYEAFRTLSEKMLEKNPKEVMFMSNLGTYWFVAMKNHRQALKYYNKVLKIKPDDYTAIKNCVLLTRRDKNVKLERKYLAMLAEYGPENEKKAARARLESL